MFGVQSVEAIYIDEPLFKEPNFKSREITMDLRFEKKSVEVFFSMVLQAKRNPEFPKALKEMCTDETDQARRGTSHRFHFFFFSLNFTNQ